MKLTQAQLVVPRAIANSQAVGLAAQKATRTGVVREYNPFNPEEYHLLAAEKADRWQPTPRDGACLFHALYESYRVAFWLPNAGLINSGAEMRTKICDFLRANGDLFQVQHSNTIRAKAAVLLKMPVHAVTYEEALPVYCQRMRGVAEWGGYPEMDAAARMLNVMVHEFRVPGENEARHTALLHATFYPIQSQLDNKAERKEVTKFVLIWRDSHYEYVAPDVPKALVSALSSSADVSVTVHDRAEYLKNRRRGGAGSSSSGSGNNGLLKAMALARESRSQQQQEGGGKCPLPEAQQLSQEQRDEMATMELIQKWQQEEADAALAQRMSKMEVY
tara:strand:- start:211 stop:1209 length:999 start_codon:yes stop_codon:yes gene_type:complete